MVERKVEAIDMGKFVEIQPLADSKDVIRGKIALAFPNEPKMIKTVECESGFRQFEDDGSPFMGRMSPDVGVMQINKVHWKRAEELGLDIFHKVDDNIAMGKVIYQEQGMDAWVCYQYNHDKY